MDFVESGENSIEWKKRCEDAFDGDARARGGAEMSLSVLRAEKENHRDCGWELHAGCRENMPIAATAVGCYGVLTCARRARVIAATMAARSSSLSGA